MIINVTSEAEPLLHVEVTGSLRSTLALRHVSGDFFLAEVSLYMLRRDPSAIVKAEFQVNAEGKVARFGAAIDFDYMPDTLTSVKNNFHFTFTLFKNQEIFYDYFIMESSRSSYWT